MVIAVLAVPVMAVGCVAVFMWAARMREVGPDADAMAEDPVLHIDVAGGAPDEIVARTGSEGGLMPAMANRTSEAFRFWTLDPGDWQATFLAAVDDIDAQGVRWRSVSCSPSDVRFQAVKEVALDGEVVTATVGVGVSGIEGGDQRPRLLVELAGEGYAPSGAPPPGDPEMLQDCPPAIAEAFTALRARR